MKLNLSGHDGCRAVMNSDVEVLYPHKNEKSLYKLNLNDHSAAQMGQTSVPENSQNPD